MDGWTPLVVFGGGVVAGLVGALMGLGGGLVAVPFLNLVLGVPMHQAAAAGLFSTLSVSCTAAGRYLRRGGLIDPARALEVELAAAAGGLLGGFVAGWLAGPVLQLVFSGVLLVGGFQIARNSGRSRESECIALSRRRMVLAFGLCFGAGALSGMLGIGGGMLVVPVLALVLCLPFKAAAATSNFMMGLTAVPALAGFLSRGDVQLGLCIPLSAGVLLGAMAGASWMPRLRTRWLELAFSLLLLGMAVELVRQGVRGW